MSIPEGAELAETITSYPGGLDVLREEYRQRISDIETQYTTPPSQETAAGYTAYREWMRPEAAQERQRRMLAQIDPLQRMLVDLERYASTTLVFKLPTQPRSKT